MFSRKKKAANKSIPNSHHTGQRMDFYPDAFSHLFDELRWLNRLLAANVIRLRNVNFYDRLKDFRSFFISDNDIDELISNGVFEGDLAQNGKDKSVSMQALLDQANALRDQINLRIKNTAEKKLFLPLMQLKKSFRLKEIELNALICCIAPQIDARYEKLFAYLHNDITQKAPSVDLINSLLGSGLEDRIQNLSLFSVTAPLRRYQLIELAENGNGISAGHRLLQADKRIVRYVLGDQEIDPQLLQMLRFFPVVDQGKALFSDALNDDVKNILKILFNSKSNERPIIYLHGRDNTRKIILAQSFCDEMGSAMAVVDMRNIQDQPGGFDELLRRILRESLLQPCAVYFDHAETIISGNGNIRIYFSKLAHHIQEMGWFTILGSEEPFPASWSDKLTIYPVKVPAPNHLEQKLLWSMFLSEEKGIEANTLPDSMVEHFNLTSGQISRAANLAIQKALARGNGNGNIRRSDLMAACRQQTEPNLGRMAQKVRPIYSWENIVVPETVMSQLHEICQRVRHRNKVLDDWGFRQKVSNCVGVNALFAGASGTGKTMAAEILANELELDLFKIDLSSVVSKYVGETESNLDLIFTAAEHANVILFFDEADALFGKRSEVRDSHDRYANIEISYLLQKMEQYKGIALLASNLRQNLDESFVRRLTFTVFFPFPDETSRLQIWQKIWPDDIPLGSDANFESLASQFRLSGGNIKNAALAAAFLAAEDNRAVGMSHLLQAIRREYQKMGKELNDSELPPSLHVVRQD